MLLHTNSFGPIQTSHTNIPYKCPTQISHTNIPYNCQYADYYDTTDLMTVIMYLTVYSYTVMKVDFVMNKLQIKNAGDVLMIGDRLDTDIEFANVSTNRSYE